METSLTGMSRSLGVVSKAIHGLKSFADLIKVIAPQAALHDCCIIASAENRIK